MERKCDMLIWYSMYINMLISLIMCCLSLLKFQHRAFSQRGSQFV